LTNSEVVDKDNQHVKEKCLNPALKSLLLTKYYRKEQNIINGSENLNAEYEIASFNLTTKSINNSPTSCNNNNNRGNTGINDFSNCSYSEVNEDTITQITTSENKKRRSSFKTLKVEDDELFTRRQSFVEEYCESTLPLTDQNQSNFICLLNVVVISKSVYNLSVDIQELYTQQKIEELFQANSKLKMQYSDFIKLTIPNFRDLTIGVEFSKEYSNKHRETIFYQQNEKKKNMKNTILLIAMVVILAGVFAFLIFYLE